MGETANHGAASYNKGHSLEIAVGQAHALELRNRLLQGASVKDLVPVIQGEWGVLKDKKPATVQTMLYRYSRKVVKQEAMQRVLATVEKAGHLSVTTLEDLSTLCKQQHGRVKKALALEEKGGQMLLTDMATKQIGLLAGMLKDLALLQMETGILPRAPKTVKGMMVGADGSPTAFGWVENDDTLLLALQSSVQATHDPT